MLSMTNTNNQWSQYCSFSLSLFYRYVASSRPRIYLHQHNHLFTSGNREKWILHSHDERLTERTKGASIKPQYRYKVWGMDAEQLWNNHEPWKPFNVTSICGRCCRSGSIADILIGISVETDHCSLKQCEIHQYGRFRYLILVSNLEEKGIEKETIILKKWNTLKKLFESTD